MKIIDLGRESELRAIAIISAVYSDSCGGQRVAKRSGFGEVQTICRPVETPNTALPDYSKPD